MTDDVAAELIDFRENVPAATSRYGIPDDRSQPTIVAVADGGSDRIFDAPHTLSRRAEGTPTCTRPVPA